MASLTPAPTSMIDRLEKYLLSCLQGENIEKIQICSKKHFIYVGNFQKLLYQTILPYLVMKTLCIVLRNWKYYVLSL